MHVNPLVRLLSRRRVSHLGHLAACLDLVVEKKADAGDYVGESLEAWRSAGRTVGWAITSRVLIASSRSLRVRPEKNKSIASSIARAGSFSST
jgi:hypothetical protein